MAYSGTPTTYGEQKIAAALAGGQPLTVVAIAVGDGGGSPVAPSEGQTSLTHEVWRGNISSWGVDPADTRRIVVHVTVPATAGPFVVREAGVYDASGGLICVTALAATEVVGPGSSNQATSIDLIIAMPIGSAGAITVSPTQGERFTIERLYRTPFISINSASKTVPPASPALGDLYIVPASATGAWATAGAGTLAEWNGTFWAFLAPPLKMVAGIMDTADDASAEYLKWNGTAWEVLATPGSIFSVVDNGTSTADEFVGTVTPALTALQTNMVFRFRQGAQANATKVPKTNLLNAAGVALGDVPFAKADGSALAIGDLPAKGDFFADWDGASMRVIGNRLSDILTAQRPVIVYTGISDASNGGFYAMDLGTQQVFTLPNPAMLTNGWYRDVLVTGSPSGFQTAFAQIAAGAGPTAFIYRGQAHTPFYLIGNGEILRFFWTGSIFLVITLGQPTAIFVRLSGATGTSAGNGSNQALLTTGSSGYKNQFRTYTTGLIVLPVSGEWQIGLDSAVIGGASTSQPTSFTIGDDLNPTNNFDNASVWSSNAMGGGINFKISSTFMQGQNIQALFNAPSGWNIQNPSNVLFASLLDR